MSGTEAKLRRSKFSPEIVIAAGCLIAVLTFGPRSAVGQFQLPILGEFGFGGDVFSFAMALQYLFWGLGQPFAGAMADKFGVISILARAVPRHLRQIRLLGLDHKLARDLPIEVNVVNLGDESLTFTRMRDVGQRLVHEHGAGVVIMGCAGMARYRQRLEDFLKVPVIDPTQAGVALAMGRVLAQQALG